MLLRGFQVVVLLALAMMAPAGAQTPVPFPKPNQPVSPLPPSSRATPEPERSQPTTTAPTPMEPSELQLGAPVYPGAQFLRSFDAGGAGQHYHLYGTNVPYGEIIAYYKKVLRKGGDEIFEMPGVHMFDTARFREESMAFPPSVTVKDYSPAGYRNPKRGGTPPRFLTIIQIVPPPAGAVR